MKGHCQGHKKIATNSTITTRSVSCFHELMKWEGLMKVKKSSVGQGGRHGYIVGYTTGGWSNGGWTEERLTADSIWF